MTMSGDTCTCKSRLQWISVSGLRTVLCIFCAGVVLILPSISPHNVWAAQSDTKPLVAAAASLRFALEEAEAVYANKTGQEVRMLYGATGTLVTQISNGAPFEIFLSADELSIGKLKAGGHVRGHGEVLVVGRLALAVTPSLPLPLEDGLAAISAALQAGRIKHFAIANPEIAPYGAAAVEALQHAGLWDRLKTHLVVGENAGQAAQFIASGAAEAGLIPLSLSRKAETDGKMRSVIIDGTWHRPIRQVMVALKPASEAALHFLDFLRQPDTQAIFARHGFSPPDTGR